MGDHNGYQRPDYGPDRSPRFAASSAGVSRHGVWVTSHVGQAHSSGMTVWPAPQAEAGARGARDAGAAFWVRPGTGYQLLMVVAAAHVGVGLLCAIVGALVWSFGRPIEALPASVAAIGAAVAVVGALTFELARAAGPRASLAARVLAPGVDLLAAGVVLGLLGDVPLALLLFVVPALLGTLLLSWRSGAALAAVSVACFMGMSTLRPGTALEAWVPETLALAGMTALTVLCVGAYTAALADVSKMLRAQVATLRGQREIQSAEQQRLLETLNLLEDGQARLERERVLVNQQIADVAGAARRLAEGDVDAARALQPGMFGPLESARMALQRLSLYVGMDARSRSTAQAQQRTLEALMAGIREQTHVLAATDLALRELGSSANELVAEVQVIERGSGELPGIDRHQLFRVMRGMEQHAMTQASSTALLGSRLAQLRTRQSQLESEMRRLSQLLAGQQEWERSGLYRGLAGTQPLSRAFGASGMIPPESLSEQGSWLHGGDVQGTR